MKWRLSSLHSTPFVKSAISAWYVGCFVVLAAAQAPPTATDQLGQRPFAEICEEMDAFYAAHPDASGRKQWGRLKYNLQSRLGPDGELYNFEAVNVKEFLQLKRALPADAGQRSTHGAWIFYGPSEIPNDDMGRINCVDFHPTDPNTIYVGSASGGAWKSVDDGNTWVPISPNIPSLAVGDIEIDPSDPNTIYLMTGDEFNSGRPSIGMLKTTDGGLTWYLTDLQFDREELVFSEKLLMHPTNPDIQYLATNNGLMQTNNGWSDFNPASTIYSTTKIFDVELAPDNPSIVYLSRLSSFPVCKSTNAGTFFNTIFDGTLNGILGSNNKVEIAVTPADPDCIYAFGGIGGTPQGLLRSMSEGAVGTWQVRDTIVSGFGGQCSYNMSLAVDSSDHNKLVAGTIGTQYSAGGGQNGSWVPPGGMHADVHESRFHQGRIYHCNDGGLFRSLPGSTTNFEELSQGMSITEFYTVAGTPQELGLLYAGSQDNGTVQRTPSGDFTMVRGNDGTACMIDYTNSDVAYVSHQWGWVYKTTDGGANWAFLTIPEGTTDDFFMPMIMDPVNPNIIFHAVDSVHRSDNAMAPGSFQNLGKPVGSGEIEEMAQGTSNRNRLYVSSGPKLFTTTNALTTSGAATWTEITASPPFGGITGIAVDPANANRVFVTVSGYTEGNKVFFSPNAGASGSWQNISGALPNVPVNCIRYHNNGSGNDATYVGTDIGVFYRDNNLGDWIYFSNYLPSVRVNDIYIYHDLDLIVAATFGRGLWLSATYSACPASMSLSNPLDGTLYFSAAQTITSTASYKMDITSHVSYSAGSFVDLKAGFRAGGQAYFNAGIGPCVQPFEGLVAQPIGGELLISSSQLEKWMRED